MRRVVTHRLGDLADLMVETVPDPVIADDGVVVDMRACVISYVNGLLAGGEYQVKPPTPFVPGTTGLGVVTEVGRGISGIAVGDRVATTRLSAGCWATRVELAPDLLVPVPEGVSDTVGAAVLEAWCTMHFAFTRRRRLAGDEVVLVLGATGAIGGAAVDIARATGARVIAVGTDRHRLRAAERRGAQIVETAEDLTSAVRDLAPGGVDVVVDPVGGDLALEALKLLAPGGTFMVLGFASQVIPRLGANRILIANRAVVGVDLGYAITEEPALGQSIMSEVLEGVAAGRYATLVRPEVCALDEVPERLRTVMARGVEGPVVTDLAEPTGPTRPSGTVDDTPADFNER